jgi:hypothetical protein
VSGAIALKPVALPFENGAPIVLLPADPNTVHIPGGGHNATGRPVTLDEHLERGGWPLAWRARCGAQGHVFVYALMFAHRKICVRCEAADL